MLDADQISMLTGRAAKPDLLTKLTWVALHHDPKVIAIDTVRAYHFGNNFLVEVRSLRFSEGQG